MPGPFCVIKEDMLRMSSSARMTAMLILAATLCVTLTGCERLTYVEALPPTSAPINEGGQLTLKMPDINFDIVTWENQMVSIEATKRVDVLSLLGNFPGAGRGYLDRFSILLSGDPTHLTAEPFWFNLCPFLRVTPSVKATVRVPKGIKLEVVANDGVIHISGTQGDVSLKLNSGTISGDNLSGTFATQLNRGSVDLAFASVPTATCALDSGPIRISLPRNSSFELDARTNGGSITSDFDAVREEEYSGEALRGTVGQGGSRVALRTGAGSIDIMAE
jgi:hypothetical protein